MLPLFHSACLFIAGTDQLALSATCYQFIYKIHSTKCPSSVTNGLSEDSIKRLSIFPTETIPLQTKLVIIKNDVIIDDTIIILVCWT